MLAERSISTLATPASDIRVMMCWRTAMSSSRRSEYSLPVANQRPSQSLTDRSPTLMPRRKPIGCTFCPKFLSSLLGDDHGDVARALQDLIDATAGAGAPAFECSPLVGGAAGNDQLIRIHVEVVLRVRDGGANRSRNRPRRAMRQEFQNGEGLSRVLSANNLEDQSHLLGRHPDVALNGANLD